MGESAMIAAMQSTPSERQGSIDALAVAAGLLAFALHAVFAGRYDIFRDELYFIACGWHPAFGYADQPPVVPLLAAAFYGLGHSVWMLRLPTSLAPGVLAWLAVRFARLLGGGGVAASLAALSVTIAPMLMGMEATLNTTAFDPLAWTAIAWCLVRGLRNGDLRALLAAGVIAGIDFEIKYALVLWGAGLVVGLALTAERTLLTRRQLWWGVALAAGIGAPSVAWQALHGFPFLELAHAARAKNTDIPAPAFVLNQVLVMSPLLAPVWISGLVAPFHMESLRPVRFLSIAFLASTALVLATHGKDYYLAACFPVMFIVGAVGLAHALDGSLGRTILATGAVGALAFSAAVSPLALPVLPVPALRSYVQALPVQPQQQERSFHGTVLPQVFADQLGWRDFAAQVRDAWRRIPASERGRTAIKADNYGEAAAVEVYGRQDGLPPPLSGHNQYFLWGLRGQDPVNLLVIQDHPEALAPFCRETQVLGVTHSPDAMRYENGKAIAFCRGLKVDLRALWPRLKNYN